MAFGSFDGDSDEPRAEINMVPLIDVMLVLLVIFMVTAPLMTRAIPLNLPQESAQPLHDPRPPVDIAIDAAGQVYWQGESLSWETLEQRLQQLGSQQPDTQIRLSADQQTPYGDVARLLAGAARHGLHKLGFVTEPPRESPRASPRS